MDEQCTRLSQKDDGYPTWLDSPIILERWENDQKEMMAQVLCLDEMEKEAYVIKKRKKQKSKKK